MSLRCGVKRMSQLVCRRRYPIRKEFSMKFHLAINLERMDPSTDMKAVRDHTLEMEIGRAHV